MGQFTIFTHKTTTKKQAPIGVFYLSYKIENKGKIMRNNIEELVNKRQELMEPLAREFDRFMSSADLCYLVVDYLDYLGLNNDKKFSVSASSCDYTIRNTSTDERLESGFIMSSDLLSNAFRNELETIVETLRKHEFQNNKEFSEIVKDFEIFDGVMKYDDNRVRISVDFAPYGARVYVTYHSDKVNINGIEMMLSNDHQYYQTITDPAEFVKLFNAITSEKVMLEVTSYETYE